MKCFVTLLLCLSPAAFNAQTPASPSASLAAETAQHTGTPASGGVLILRTAVTSKNATEGKEIKAALQKAVTLPNGQVLPKSTVLRGHVVQVSAHSKERKNGALLLVFDEVLQKDGPAISVLVQIQKLSPSTAAETNTISLPGAKIGGTSNSGGSSFLAFERGSVGSLTTNMKQSDIQGIYLQNTAGGSGTIFALGEDVYLDPDIHMTVLIAPAPPKLK